MTNIHKILVTGSSGQLGQSLNAIADQYPNYSFTFAHRAELDLSDAKHVTAYFQNHSFDLIINCAAYTAVDKAESEPDLANQLNHLAVKQLAEIAKQQNAKLLHISTDYVFNGRQYRPYIESDKVDPQSIYGSSKLKGEQALLDTLPNNGIIIRTSWVYSEYGNNFVKTMIKLGKSRDNLSVIFDQVGTPTYAHDLATTIMAMVSSESFNQDTFTSDIVHFSNEGVCSWYDFAKTIFELSGIKCDVAAIETKDYPTAATRPHYSLLNKAKIKDNYNIVIPYWKDALVQCLSTLKQQETA